VHLKSRYPFIRQREFTHHIYSENLKFHIFYLVLPLHKAWKGSDLLNVCQAGIGEDYAV
jgi:hypothetical protein